MRMPAHLLEAVERETARIDRRQLLRAAAQLTEHYQAADFSTPAILTEAHRAAYLAVRMPATYAAARRALAELRLRAPYAEIGTMLDLGSGPGTALFAASEEFHLQQATLLESDAAWLALGKRLSAQIQPPAATETQWLQQDLRSGHICKPHDLVVISYTLGELPQAAAEALLRKAWSCATKFLVLIEPGTRRGFATVNTARSALIASAARIIAPCPHQRACPMALSGDWCHFSQRVQRTSQHRQLKGGELGYEDEKFSYLVAAKAGELQPDALDGDGLTPSGASPARIVRHPGKHSGHIQLSLCTTQGEIENRTVTRSSKSAYKLARKAEWGDTWME
jgi:ribosomal protein RSM22 (predicted rRNA methylase)